jgi:hypothetical protein
MIIGSLGVFFYFGKFRASIKQRDRSDKIDWTQSLWSKIRSKKQKKDD